jgi:hypothetical protein
MICLCLSLRMRWTPLLLLVAAPLLAFAQDAVLHSLPQAVQETVDMEKGEGIAKSAESYPWGDITIYRIEIDVNNVPTLELQIAENGKLLRVDRLQPEKEDDSGEEED